MLAEKQFSSLGSLASVDGTTTHKIRDKPIPSMCTVTSELLRKEFAQTPVEGEAEGHTLMKLKAFNTIDLGKYTLKSQKPLVSLAENKGIKYEAGLDMCRPLFCDGGCTLITATECSRSYIGSMLTERKSGFVCANLDPSRVILPATTTLSQSSKRPGMSPPFHG